MVNTDGTKSFLMPAQISGISVVSESKIAAVAHKQKRMSKEKNDNHPAENSNTFPIIIFCLSKIGFQIATKKMKTETATRRFSNFRYEIPSSAIATKGNTAKGTRPEISYFGKDKTQIM